MKESSRWCPAGASLHTRPHTHTLLLLRQVAVKTEHKKIATRNLVCLPVRQLTISNMTVPHTRYVFIKLSACMLAEMMILDSVLCVDQKC
jgi:hypothetical protein